MTDTHADTQAQAFADAIAIANIPTLLMVLVQLTGDLRWLEEPFRPTRGAGITDHDTGGLGVAEQGIVRSAALDAILAWRGGRPVAIPEPEPALRQRMLSVATGDAIPNRRWCNSAIASNGSSYCCCGCCCSCESSPSTFALLLSGGSIQSR